MLPTEEILDLPAPEPDERIPYGDQPSQFGDLRIPSGGCPHPIALVIHGGSWRRTYSLDHIGHLSAALTERGLATWSLEYRRIGEPGGGWSGTLEDVAAGATALRSLARDYALDIERVVAVGHSAGGQLALWLAAERTLQLRGVVSLAGTADLARAWELVLSDGIVAELLGGSPSEVPDRYNAASPIERVPLGVPQIVIHGTEDDEVPFEIGERYVSEAIRHGDEARLVRLEGVGHYELIDPRSSAWPAVQEAVRSLF